MSGRLITESDRSFHFDLTVVVWWTESILLNTPSGWKNNEICDSRSISVTGTSQYGEYARVLAVKRFKVETKFESQNSTYAMIKADGIDHHEISQIIFEWYVVSVPCNHIKW